MMQMTTFAWTESKYDSYWVKNHDVLEALVLKIILPNETERAAARALVATISILLSPLGSSSRVKRRKGMIVGG